MSQVLILAGGLGTRFRPVFSDRPKALAPVHGEPFLTLILKRLAAQGIQDIVIGTGYLAPQIESYFGNGEALGLRIRYSVEERPVGTGGAVRLALPQLTSPFLVMNGDTLVDADLQALLTEHTFRAADLSIACVRSRPNEARGTLILGPDHRVASFAEKNAEIPGRHVNAGIYVFEERVIAGYPVNQSLSLELEVFPQAVAAGLRVFGVEVAKGFHDIGTPEGYEGLLHDGRYRS